MKLDVIDFGDPAVGHDSTEQVRPYSDGIISMYPMSNGVVKMIADVRTMVNGAGMINVLRIWGHGWAGGQMVAGGSPDDTSGIANRSALWGPDISSYRDDLATLSELFAPDGRLELKGCCVATGTPGEMFMVKLAVALNRNVVASTEVQGGPGAETAIGSVIGWDGIQVTMAYPDYTVTYGPGANLNQ